MSSLGWVKPRQRTDTSLMKTQNYVHCSYLFILNPPLPSLFNYLKTDNTEQLEDRRETGLRSGNYPSNPEGLYRQLRN